MKPQYTVEEADTQFGKIVYQTNNKIVRAREQKGKLVVYVHSIHEGKEQLPMGYMMGFNFIEA